MLFNINKKCCTFNNGGWRMLTFKIYNSQILIISKTTFQDKSKIWGFLHFFFWKETSRLYLRFTMREFEKFFAGNLKLHAIVFYFRLRIVRAFQWGNWLSPSGFTLICLVLLGKAYSRIEQSRHMKIKKA